ncbi:MAG: DNA repair exonuclease [Candidatus Aegiribacteria sp.]
MIRFLHTGDWQLGMTRHFFSEGVGERYAQSRFDAIRELGRVAEEEECSFMLVCGDVFDSNYVDRKTVSRAVEALKNLPVPVYLLPGNHDPLDAASVYSRSAFLERKPDHVHVIDSSDPILVEEGLEIVGVPWFSKRPMRDLVTPVLEGLEQSAGTVRICAAHGIVDSLAPDPDSPELISLEASEKAISRGKIHYLALGDRHSVTDVGETGRAWYAGTPESTDFKEVKSGFALVTRISEDDVSVQEVEIGKWTFIERAGIDMNTEEDLEALREWFEGLENKERLVLKLRFAGSVSLSLNRDLMEFVDGAKEIAGAVETRYKDLTVIPEDTDFTELGLSGFAQKTVERLRELDANPDSSSSRARDALALLVRLAGGDS